MLRGLILLSFLLSPSAWATISNITFSGSYSVAEPKATPTPIVYAGRAGTACTGSPCDNCSGALAACNHSYVNESSDLVITFRSTLTAGRAVIFKSGQSTAITATTTFVGGTGTITVSWSNLCNMLDNTNSNTSCATSGVATLSIGIDNNNTETTLEDSASIVVKVQNEMDPTTTVCATGVKGICDINMYPGDEKVYLLKAFAGEESDFPNSTNIQYTNILLYYAVATDGVCDAAEVGTILNNSPYKSTGITADSSDFVPTQDSFDGFQNDITYCFKAAVQDQAGNIGLFMLNSQFDGTIHQVKPEAVGGILTENKCFIATAAFGSPFERHVQTLRKFRNKFLLSNLPGRQFVRQYYKNSPPLAHVIRKNETLRFFARTLLWPVWVYAWLSLQTGSAFLPMLIFSMLMGFIFMGWRLWTNRWQTQ